MAANNKKPTHTLPCGHIKATIWQNASEDGPFFATRFSRLFKDQSGQWRNGTSFGLNDLEALEIYRIQFASNYIQHTMQTKLLSYMNVIIGNRIA